MVTGGPCDSNRPLGSPRQISKIAETLDLSRPTG
jgi:hypothetical protein